jgi:hypothetical protein
VGLFGKSEYEKYKPIYNMWLHARKSAINRGMSLADAEAYAMEEPMQFYGVSQSKMLEIIEIGRRKGWGADRLRDL